jgi:hypothetical protein
VNKKMPITDGNGNTIEPIGGWRILANSTDRKTINLDAAPESVRKISIEDTVGDAGTSNVTINPSGSQTIDGSSSIVLDANYQRKVLESTGTGWTVVASAVAGVNTTDTGDLTVDSLSIRDAFSFPTSDGTDGQVLKTDGNGTLTWENDNTGSGGGGVSASDLTSSVVYYDELYDENYTTNNEQEVSHSRRYHINIPQSSQSTWHDIVSWRPLDLSNRGSEPGASTYWGAVAFNVKVGGTQTGVGGGNGMIDGIGGIQYVGSNAYYANDLSTDSFGTTPSMRVQTSGWTTTIQFNPSGGDFMGWAYIELHFGRGAGSKGEGVYWEVTLS